MKDQIPTLQQIEAEYEDYLVAKQAVLELTSEVADCAGALDQHFEENLYQYPQKAKWEKVAAHRSEYPGLYEAKEQAERDLARYQLEESKAFWHIKRTNALMRALQLNLDYDQYELTLEGGEDNS